MSIYDEAIKDFDILVGGEELKEIIEYPPSGNWHNLYVNVKKALERAKKVEELLELYKELSFIRKFEYKKQEPSETEKLCMHEIKQKEEMLK